MPARTDAAPTAEVDESLPKSEQGSAKAATAGFLPTHEAPGAAPRVATLPLGVVDPLAKIEPDDSIAGAMPLRLSFITKRGQRQGGHICRAANGGQCRQKISHTYEGLLHR
jgi:hypothetical protein